MAAPTGLASIPHDDQQVVVVLHHRASKTILPHVPRGAVPLSVSAGVGHGERLEDPADRLPRARLEQEVEVVAHQAVTEQREGIAALRDAERLEKGLVIAIAGELVGSVVAAVHRVEVQAVVGRARKTYHNANSSGRKLRARGQEKSTDTNFPRARHAAAAGGPQVVDAFLGLHVRNGSPTGSEISRRRRLLNGYRRSQLSRTYPAVC